MMKIVHRILLVVLLFLGGTLFSMAQSEKPVKAEVLGKTEVPEKSEIPVQTQDSTMSESSQHPHKPILENDIKNILNDTIINFPDSASVDTMYQDAVERMKKAGKLSKYLTWKPDPIRAMWLGLVIPGAGQIYNRKYWKLPIFYGGFIGCLYALTWNSQMLSDYTQAYLDISDSDPNTKSYEKMLPIGYDITGKESRFQEIFKNRKNTYRKYRDLSLFAFIAVYALTVVDAYVDAELSTFDISPDLSLHFAPTFIHTSQIGAHRWDSTPGISCQLTF